MLFQWIRNFFFKDPVVETVPLEPKTPVEKSDYKHWVNIDNAKGIDIIHSSANSSVTVETMFPTIGEYTSQLFKLSSALDKNLHIYAQHYVRKNSVVRLTDFFLSVDGYYIDEAKAIYDFSEAVYAFTSRYEELEKNFDQEPTNQNNWAVLNPVYVNIKSLVNELQLFFDENIRRDHYGP